MRRLAFILPVLFAFALMLGQRSMAQSPGKPFEAHDLTTASSQRLVIFEAFLRPG